MYLSDKLSNIRSLYKDFRNNGIKAFDRFHVNNIEEQAWYYYEVLNNVLELSNTDVYKEYKIKLDYIFNYQRSFENGEKSNTL